MAGYSKTPLARKLGIKPSHRMVLIGPPDGFERLLQPLPEGVVLSTAYPAERLPDLILLFSPREAMLHQVFEEACAHLRADAAVWVAWPKKASKVPTDLSFAVVQGIALAAGLVDVKVCAIDEVWSGLKLMVRKEDRATWPLQAG